MAEVPDKVNLISQHGSLLPTWFHPDGDLLKREERYEYISVSAHQKAVAEAWEKAIAIVQAKADEYGDNSVKFDGSTERWSLRENAAIEIVAALEAARKEFQP